MVAGEPELAGLEAERARLYAELSGVGDFRRGTLSRGVPQVRQARTAGARGRASGVTARSGTGPGGQGGKTVTTHPRPGPELGKAEREAGEWERFRALTGQIEEVNEAICDARPALAGPGAAGP